MITLRRFQTALLIVLCSFLIAPSALAQFLGQQSLSRSSYVIDKNGRLFTFGWNVYGQLGVGDKTDRNTPIEVPVPPGASRWTLAAGGAQHALAVADSDKLYAWGSNRYGQLGTGTLGEVVVPTRVQNPPGVTAWKWVTAGRDHSLALSSTGQLYAWGNNVDGQLGTGNRYMATTPKPVLRANGVNVWSEVAAGPGYTLAVSADGSLFGWGKDSMGICLSTAPQHASGNQYRTPSPMMALSATNSRESSVLATGFYGNGPGKDFLNPPSSGYQPQVAGDADGGFHSLAIEAGGVLRALGANEHGQLGVGDTTPEGVSYHRPPFAVTVSNPRGVTQFVAVAAGLYHSLALGNDGNLYVWGGNSNGELGLGADSLKRTWPARLMTIGDSIRIRAGISGAYYYTGTPVTETLTVTNTASATPLRPTGMLIPCIPITLDDSAQTKPLAPTPLSLGASDTVSWTVEGWQYLIDQTEYYFVYVQAPGSAPYLLQGGLGALAKPINEWMAATVVDSLTGVGLPYGVCAFTTAFGEPPHDTVHVDGDGILKIHFSKWGFYDAYLARENYLTKVFQINAPPEGDTLPQIELGPAPVQGLFSTISDITPIEGMTKLYYPDSLIGFAISRNTIWRTTDSGAHWNAIFVSLSNNDLNDIRFANPRVGIAVGDAGEILTTTNGGDTWTEETAGTTSNLHAVVYSGRDTAWAIGDAGTVVERTLDTSGHPVWTALPSLGNYPLTAIHFFDATHGAIVTKLRCYIYDGSTWQILFTGSWDLRAAYYVTPRSLFLAGAHGVIANAFAGGAQPTLTTQTISGLYFLNSQVGFASGDSSSSLVTYDGGFSWAPLEEVKGNARSMNFYCVNGHLLGGGRPMNYTGHANPIAGIVQGHVVTGDPSVPATMTGIRGAIVDRRFSIKTGMIVDTLWTNELGNFVFASVTDTFHYDYTIYYRTGGVAKSHMWRGVSVKAGEIITLGFLDTVLVPPPPPPDTQRASVAESSRPAIALSIERAETGALRAVMTLPSEAQAELAIFDVMGRRIRTLADAVFEAGSSNFDIPASDLTSGTYYVRLLTPMGERIAGFALMR